MTPERQRMCDHLIALAHLGHAGAGCCDRPGRLRPERHRSRAADPPAADPDKLVPVADAGGGDVDQDLVFGRRRQLVHLKDLDGLAECSDPGRSHPAARTLLASVMPARTALARARGVRREQVANDLTAPEMLLCLSSRHWGSVFEEAVEAAGEVALEAAGCFAPCLAFLQPSFDVSDRGGV